MDTDNSVDKAWGGGRGWAGKGQWGRKGIFCNTSKNKDKFNIKNKKESLREVHVLGNHWKTTT